MADIQEIKDSVDAEFSTRLLGGNPVLPQSNFDIMAGFIAFLQFGNEKFIESVRDGVTPVGSTGSNLESWGSTYGVGRLAASAASGTITLSGTNGSILPAGTVLTRCDSFQYVTNSDATIVGGNASVSVTASTAGSSGNFPAGGVLNVGSVTAGINNVALSQGISGGSEIECDDNYRVRILSAIRTPCRTGTAEDYDFWVRQYPGVTRVCVLEQPEGPGTVSVFFMMDDTYPDGVPMPADVTAVSDSLFGAGGLAPLGIVGTAQAPTLLPVDVTLSFTEVVSAQDAQAIQDAISAAFLDFFDCGQSLVCPADIAVAVRTVTSACFTINSPASNQVVPSGSVPILGSLTFV